MRQGLLTLLSVALLAAEGSAAGNCVTDATQADFQAGVASNLDLTSAGNVQLATAGASGGSIDQQNTSITINGDAFTNVVWTGQTFTARASGALAKVDVNLFCSFCSMYGNPPPIIVSIRATAGGLPSGSDLASASLTITDISGLQAFYSASFSAPANVTAGTQYALLIHASAAYGGSLGKQLGFSDSAQANGSQGGDVYSGGSLIHSTSGGSSWSVVQYSIAPTTSDGGFRTYIGGSSGYNSNGDLTSSLKDSSPPAGSTPTWSTLSWTTVIPQNTLVKFQAAASNTTGGPFNFVGPDGSAASYFTTSNASLAQFNGNRYLKYRAFLSTTNSASTPVINDVSFCSSSQTTTPTADLSITNSDGQSSVAAGAQITYQIQAKNSGPNDVSGASVVDTFPNGLSCTWSCAGSGGGTCAASGSGNINASVNLPNGGQANFTAVCSIPSSATGTLTNAATINPPAGATDPNTANNSASDTDSLSVQADVAVSVSNGVNMVEIGGDVSYVITLTNAGPSDAAVNLVDNLPLQLGSGSWVCSGTGGASCSSKANGNTMNTNATVPVGGVATYVYSAVVASDTAGDLFTNTATARVTNGSDPNGANNSAGDTDTIVLFLSGFENQQAAAANIAGSIGGGGSVTVQLGVDAGLLNSLGPAPVTVASGRSADGRKLFGLQLMHLGGDVMMRTLTTIDDTAFSDASPWQIVDLKQHILGLQWQSASARGDDGYLRTGPATQQALVSANNARENLTELKVTVENNIPWLVVIEP